MYSQRCLEEPRAKRESSKLNMASRLDQGMKGDGGVGGRVRGEVKIKTAWTEETERGRQGMKTKERRYSRNSRVISERQTREGMRCRAGEPLSWRSLGEGWSEKSQSVNVDSVIGTCDSERARRPACTLVCR